jgi:Spy/CpxP family protein refolding chaperone
MGGMMGEAPPRNDSPNDGRSHNGHQLGLPGRWWDDKHFAHNINIRPDQQHKMDDIFEANKSQLLTAYSNLQREEQNLSAMKSQDLKDESKVFASIDRVAQARADLEKESAHISMQIRQQLDADQVTRLDKEIASNH